ncbi:hypothetical protein LIER_07807 [Lithospermum erythrorhizon]|uniref:Reverse transcriptase domain-containing protein n=1 Tax=Lithospermum erythrorhizon TaxID=34254 RepID=A0AAV3P9K1_LITER
MKTSTQQNLVTWACVAFYVNKRTEQVWEKLRLVINYQPLNIFLADDKFPLPKRDFLFQKITQAKIFSKFDLKAGFWQLGIKPEDRPKTGFCIPDHHLHWEVIPFGVKIASSLFQKAMTKIFEPLLPNALIYIDDILLFSSDPSSHSKLLLKFHDIKKIIIGEERIEFLGMHISEGKFQLQPHIANELKTFPDENLTFKQVQQFLGIVNYMADFIHNLTKYQSILSAQLKKNATKWDEKYEEPAKDTILAMRFQYDSSKDSSEDGFEHVQNKFDVLDLCPMEPCQEKAADATPPSPNVKIYIFTYKYYVKPIPVIAYLTQEQVAQSCSRKSFQQSIGKSVRLSSEQQMDNLS